jgi:N-acyl-D-aspartate/D-glutamate deacylase
LGKYVREDKIMPLETAIYKMTGQSADFFGFKNRGRIAVGNFADLVLLDPATVIDQANIKNSKALSTGIDMVWVNGTLVYQAQKSTGKQPGVLIKRK